LTVAPQSIDLCPNSRERWHFETHDIFRPALDSGTTSARLFPAHIVSPNKKGGSPSAKTNWPAHDVRLASVFQKQGENRHSNPSALKEETVSKKSWN
jgi:hypothetical protein